MCRLPQTEACFIQFHFLGRKSLVFHALLVTSGLCLVLVQSVTQACLKMHLFFSYGSCPQASSPAFLCVSSIYYFVISLFPSENNTFLFSEGKSASWSVSPFEAEVQCWSAQATWRHSQDPGALVCHRAGDELDHGARGASLMHPQQHPIIRVWAAASSSVAALLWSELTSTCVLGNYFLN